MGRKWTIKARMCTELERLCWHLYALTPEQVCESDCVVRLGDGAYASGQISGLKFGGESKLSLNVGGRWFDASVVHLPSQEIM